MSTLKGACIIGQSGGPTAVINSSALGAIETALKNENITQVLAAKNGVVGILNDELFDCSFEDPAELARFRNTPSSVIGSCRYKLKDCDVDDTDYKRILEIFKKYNVRYFFYNGGNDSMDTCNKISKYMLKVGYECRIMGIPKTIDNDLFGTDHCPGFGSAAKYIATSIVEVCRDIGSYTVPALTIFEIMGRNAGWLTAAAALCGEVGCAPDLIYLPEVDFDIDKFMSDLSKKIQEKAQVLVVVSEGIHDKNGKFISEYGSDLASTKDAFGHSQMGGLAQTLLGIIKTYDNGKYSKLKARGIEFSLLQRCASHCASKTDVEEAYLAGEAAVLEAVAGNTDKMVAFEREYVDGKYVCKTKLVDLSVTANAEHLVPREWINEEGNNIKHEFVDYALPLIQGELENTFENGLPRYPHFKGVFAKDVK